MAAQIGRNEQAAIAYATGLDLDMASGPEPDLARRLLLVGKLAGGLTLYGFQVDWRRYIDNYEAVCADATDQTGPELDALRLRAREDMAELLLSKAQRIMDAAS